MNIFRNRFADVLTYYCRKAARRFNGQLSFFYCKPLFNTSFNKAKSTGVDCNLRGTE